MRLFNHTIGIACIATVISGSCIGQITQLVTPAPTSAADFFFTVDPSPDPAMRHNRLLRDRTGDGVYRQVGSFKVTGTPYLFGQRNNGDLFSSEATAYNILISYNTYNQEVEFISTSNPDQPLVKSPGEVDSFVLQTNLELGIIKPLKFIYGPNIGSKEKVYYEEIYTGSKYSVYKRYKSELGYVSSNYSQPDLRQFDLVAEYAYVDSDGKMKKLKPNTSAVVKEFKNVKDLSPVLKDELFAANTEETFRKIFEFLNK